MSFYFEYPWKQWKALTPIDFLVEKSKIQHFDKKLTLEVRNRSLSKIYKFHDIYQNWLKQCFFFPVNFFFPSVKKIKKSAREIAREKKMKIKSVRETKKVSVKDAKISKKCPWNKKSVREKSEKNVRESNFLPWKKPKKRPKMAFTHTFGFHGKKKKHWIKEWSLEVI